MCWEAEKGLAVVEVAEDLVVRRAVLVGLLLMVGLDRTLLVAVVVWSH